MIYLEIFLNTIKGETNGNKRDYESFGRSGSTQYFRNVEKWA